MCAKVVAFASEQGTSEDLAKDIGSRLGLDVVNFSTLDPSKLPDYNLIIFVVATYGRGAPPRACRDAWEAIKSYSEQLPNLHFAVYGVGSSNFARTFVAFAKAVEQKFRDLGATEIASLGILDADEEQSTNLDDWIKSINV